MCLQSQKPTMKQQNKVNQCRLSQYLNKHYVTFTQSNLEFVQFEHCRKHRRSQDLCCQGAPNMQSFIFRYSVLMGAGSREGAIPLPGKFFSFLNGKMSCSSALLVQNARSNMI